MRSSQCVSADRVFINGQVLTLETAEKSCLALAIKEGLICGLGDTEQVKHLIGPHTQVTDLQGKTLMPGLIDGHARLVRGVASLHAGLPCGRYHWRF